MPSPQAETGWVVLWVPQAQGWVLLQSSGPQGRGQRSKQGRAQGTALPLASKISGERPQLAGKGARGSQN